MLGKSLAMVLIIIGFVAVAAAQQQPVITKNREMYREMFMQAPLEPNQQQRLMNMREELIYQRDLLKKQTEVINSLAEKLKLLEAKVSALEDKGR